MWWQFLAETHHLLLLLDNYCVSMTCGSYGGN